MRTARTTVTHLLATALLLFGSGAVRLHAQQEQELETEQAFFLFMNIYGLTPSTQTWDPSKDPMDVRTYGDTYLQYYVTIFDNATFTAKRNDEFERQEYIAVMQKKLSTGIAGARFDKKYIRWAMATFEEYSFSTKSFPIFFEPYYTLRILELKRLLANGVIDNYADFGFRNPNDTRGAMSLAMPEVEAKVFLAQRRAANGQVNRAISLKVTYSVLNKRGQPGNVMGKSFGLVGLGREMLLFVHSIDIYGYQGGKKLGTIYPTKSFDEYTKENEYKFLSITDITIIGEWEGRGGYTGQSIKINKDKSCEWRTPTITYTGRAEFQDIPNADREPNKYIGKIEKAVNNKVTLYDKMLCLLSTVDNKPEKACLILCSVGSKLYAFGGGESYFEFIK